VSVERHLEPDPLAGQMLKHAQLLGQLRLDLDEIASLTTDTTAPPRPAQGARGRSRPRALTLGVELARPRIGSLRTAREGTRLMARLDPLPLSPRPQDPWLLAPAPRDR
jgi:hypothetical protein